MSLSFEDHKPTSSLRALDGHERTKVNDIGFSLHINYRKKKKEEKKKVLEKRDNGHGRRIHGTMLGAGHLSSLLFSFFGVKYLFTFFFTVFSSLLLSLHTKNHNTRLAWFRAGGSVGV